MYAHFDRFSLQVTKSQALKGSHPGDCASDIAELLKDRRIARQFNKIPSDSIVAELAEYGAWDSDELADIEQNKARILWIACGNILEELL